MFGLLGFPLGHSFSKKYFEGRLDYRNFEYETVEEFLHCKPSSLEGFNVTIPHKQAIIPYLTSVSREAKEIGAVNCVKVVNGQMHGYNTDCYGFSESLKRFVGDDVKQALVLGNGGASKAVQFALHNLGIDFVVVSRNSDVNYDNLQDSMIRDAQLIVNTTSLGMCPKIDAFPKINYTIITKNHYLYDLVYNPLETMFIKLGAKMGAKTKNGLEMLHLQADRSLEIWTL